MTVAQFLFIRLEGFKAYETGYLLVALAFLLVLITNIWLLRWLWSAEIDDYSAWRMTVAQFLFILFLSISLLILINNDNPYLDCFYKGGRGSYFAIWRDLPTGSG